MSDKPNFIKRFFNAAIAFPGWGINPAMGANGQPVATTGSVPPPPEGQPYTPKDLRTAISPLQLTRIRQDVATWRAAIGEAENAWLPHRVKMQRIFIDTVLNGHVSSCLEKRRNLTRLREFELQDAAGKENEEWTAWFKSQWFEDMAMYILDAKFFGYSLVGIGDIVDGAPEDCFIIKRWDVSPDRDNVTNLPYMPSGVAFKEGPQANWHVWIPTNSEVGARVCGYGLLYKVALYEILLRDVLGQWADYTEVYGQPTRWAQTKKLQGDPEFALLESALQNMASNPYLITDLDDKLTIIESKADNGKGGIYDTFAMYLMQQIAKNLLGHADALESTPGKLGGGQGGVVSPQQIALDEIQAVDGRFVESAVNKELIPKLRNIGIAIPEGLTFKFVNDAELQEQRATDDKNRLATATWVLAMSQAGIEVDPKFITDVTGVPVTKSEVEPDMSDPFAVKSLRTNKAIQNRI